MRKILRKGQLVRVSLKKNLFQKRSTHQLSEVFMIAKVYIVDPISYALEDLRGEPLEELKTVRIINLPVIRIWITEPIGLIILWSKSNLLSMQEMVTLIFR